MVDLPDPLTHSHWEDFFGMVNRPFPSSTNSHFNNGAKCEIFICVRIKSHFHINSFALIKPRFETEAWDNLEMAYYLSKFLTRLAEETKIANELLVNLIAVKFSS